MNHLRALIVFSLLSATIACRCVPGALELETSLKNGDDAVRVFVEQEITPKRLDINDPRFWRAKVTDVFQGCGVAASASSIVIKTGGNSALCGAQLQSSTEYLLIGHANDEAIAALGYKGTVLSINTCTLNTPFSSLDRNQLTTIYGLQEPSCGGTVDCKTCPLGFFDGCNSCFCGPDGSVGCTRKFCPPGTETEAHCNCQRDVKRCEDGSTVSRNPFTQCEFDTCPEPAKCCDSSKQPFCRGEGSQCCPEGEWTCSIGDGKNFPCGGKLISEGFGKPCNPPVGCKEDLQLCFDGSSVSRNPKENCEFNPCPPPTCRNCPFGYNDGCNDCECGLDGRATCGNQLCLAKGEPKCFPEPLTCQRDVFECADGTFVGRDRENECKFKKCPLPKGCSELDSCYLVDLRTTPATESKLDASTSNRYRLVEGKSEYSIYCKAEGKLNQVTFYYPNGQNDYHVEYASPWYMRGDSGNYVQRVPYLNKGCGKKRFTVEGRTWSDVCFSVTMELDAICR